jgi:uncharacterized membrane protein
VPRKVVLLADQWNSVLKWTIIYGFVYAYWSPMVLLYDASKGYLGCRLAAVLSVAFLLVSGRLSIWLVLTSRKGVNKYKHEKTRFINDFLLIMVSLLSIYVNLMKIAQDIRDQDVAAANAAAVSATKKTG